MTWFISPAHAEDAPAPVSDAPAAEASATATTAHEGGEHGSFPPFDSSTFPSQLLWLAVVFIVLYRLMAKRIIPQITGIIEARAAAVQADIDTAEASRAASEAAVAAYEEALGKARAKAGAIAAETRSRVNREIDDARRAAEGQLNQRLELAEKHVEDVKMVALAHVHSIAIETTGALVDSLIGSVPNDEVTAAVSNAEKA